MKRITFFILVYLLLTSTYLGAVNNYHFKELNISNGLSNSKVNDICIDYKGYIWIATPYGLNCYDRDKVIPFLHQRNDSLSLPSNNIFFVKEDHFRQLWIGTHEGLCVYNRNDSKFHRVMFENKPITIYSFLADQKGVYLGEKGEIYRYDYQSKRISKLEVKKETPLYSKFLQLTRYDDNTLLVNTRWHGIYSYNLSTGDLSSTDFIPKGNNLCVFVDSKKRLWVSDYGLGLSCYENNKQLVHFDSKNSPLTYNVIHTLEEKDGDLWIGTDGGGINILSLSDFSFKPPLRQNDQVSFPTNSIHCLYRDPMNNMWAGSIRNGAVYIYDTSTKTFQAVSGDNPYRLNNRSINCIVEGNENSIWIGTDGGGINRYNPSDDTFTKYEAIANEKVTSIIELNENELLVSFFNKGLYTFNHKTGYIRPFYNYNFSKNIAYEGNPIYINRCDKENIVFSSVNVYLYNIFTNEYKIIASKYKDYERNTPLIEIGDDKNIYIIDLYKILEYDPVKQNLIEIYRGEDIINDASVDRNNTIWIATTKGLMSFNPKTKQKTTIKSEILRSVAVVRHDHQDHLWIGTSSNRLFLYNQKTEQISMLSEADGFIPNEYTLNGILISKSGQTYIGGTMGMTIVCDKILRSKKDENNLKLVDVTVNGQTYSDQLYEKGLKISLPHNLTSVKLKINIGEDNLFRKHALRYTITNNERKEELFTFKQSFETHYLPEGKNKIEVSYITSTGEWSKEKTLAEITVLPPWWKSPWFIILCVVVFLVSYVLITYYIQHKGERKRKLVIEDAEKRIAEEKIHFLINISQELRTPLTMITSPLKDILEKNDLPTPINQKLRNIYRQSLNIKSLVDLVLEVKKLKEGEQILNIGTYSLNQWLKDSAEYYRKELKLDKIEIKYDLEENIKKVSFDKDKCAFILNCFMMNAVRMGNGCTTLTIISKFTAANMIRVEVKTNSRALEDIDLTKLFSLYHQVKNGSGQESIRLSYSKSLIDLHNGKIGVNNYLGNNLAFYFEIPSIAQKPLYKDEEISIEYPNVQLDLSKYKNCTIVIITESKDFRNYLKVALHKDFSHVYGAQNGRDGLSLIKSVLPDIIISDLMMTNVNGFKICQTIKQDKDTKDIPLILLSSYDTHTNITTAYSLGADILLPKPFNISTLLYVINNLLNKSKKTQRTEIHQRNNVKAEGDVAIMNNADEKFMERLNKLIEDNMEDTELDVKFLTENMGISRTSLFSRLKEVKNIGIVDYINTLRIRRACYLLKTTQMNITEISIKVGFSSPKYFSRVFKQFISMTPTEYRNS